MSGGEAECSNARVWDSHSINEFIVKVGFPLNLSISERTYGNSEFISRSPYPPNQVSSYTVPNRQIKSAHDV